MPTPGYDKYYPDFHVPANLKFQNKMWDQTNLHKRVSSVFLAVLATIPPDAWKIKTRDFYKDN